MQLAKTCLYTNNNSYDPRSLAGIGPEVPGIRTGETVLAMTKDDILHGGVAIVGTDSRTFPGKRPPLRRTTLPSSRQKKPGAA